MFREDDCPARDSNAHKNLNSLRKLVQPAAKRVKSCASERRGHQCAGWSEDYFAKLAGAFLKAWPVRPFWVANAVKPRWRH